MEDQSSCSGVAELFESGHSYCNRAEAHHVVHLVDRCVKANVAKAAIGVITPVSSLSLPRVSCLPLRT